MTKQKASRLLALIVGRDICRGFAAWPLDSLEALDFICVRDVAHAEWIMRDGYSCDILVIDSRKFQSELEIDGCIGTNPQAVVILTDPDDLETPSCRRRLRRAISESRQRQAPVSMTFRLPAGNADQWQQAG